MVKRVVLILAVALLAKAQIVVNPQPGSSFNPAAPGTIGGTTPGIGIFSTLNGSCEIVGTNTIASCVTALGAAGGRIHIPGGTTVTVASISLNNLQSITIEGDSNGAGNLNAVPPSQIILTAASGPLISLKSTSGIRLTNLAIMWNNASFTGDVVNSDHNGGTDTNNLEIDHCFFGISGSGHAATNVLNLNKTITSFIHHNWFYTPTTYVIAGDATTNDYSVNITIGPGNTFNGGAGVISGSTIHNPDQGWNIVDNVFEQSIGAGSPSVILQDIAVFSNVNFIGNWVGDTPAGYNGYLFNFTAGYVLNYNLTGNIIVMHNSSTGAIVHFAGSNQYGFNLSNNELGGPEVFEIAANVNGLSGHGNFIAAGMTTLIHVASGNLNGLDWSANGGNTPTNYLTGTVASGCIENATWVKTCYGGSLGTNTVASGTTASSGAGSLNNLGSIATATCATLTITATGVLATDVLSFSPNASLAGVVGFTPATTGGINIVPYASSGNVNFDACNWSGGSLTIGTGAQLNWRVAR